MISGFDLYASPERHVVLDLLGGAGGVGVIPGRTLVLGSVDRNVVIRGDTLPGASAALVRLDKKLLAD